MLQPVPPAPEEETVSRKRYERERAARMEAEELLEKKSRELYEANLRLEQLILKEREIAELKTSFLSVISHEFRTPLTIIQGAANRISKLADKNQPHDIVERCVKIQNSVDRLTQLVEQCMKEFRR